MASPSPSSTSGPNSTPPLTSSSILSPTSLSVACICSIFSCVFTLFRVCSDLIWSMAFSCLLFETSCRSLSASNSPRSFDRRSSTFAEAFSTLSSMSSTFWWLVRVRSLHSSTFTPSALICSFSSAILCPCFSISLTRSFKSLVGSSVFSSCTCALSSSNRSAAVVCFRVTSDRTCSMAVSCLRLETSWRSLIASNSCISISFVFTTLSPISATLLSMSSKCSSCTLVSSRLSATSPTTMSVTLLSTSLTAPSKFSSLESILLTSWKLSFQIPFSFLIAFILAWTSSLTTLSSSFTLPAVDCSVSCIIPSILWKVPTSCFLK